MPFIKVPVFNPQGNEYEKIKVHYLEGVNDPESSIFKIAIHGNSGSVNSFSEMISGKMTNIFYVDLPGHGLSDAPKTDECAKAVYSFNGYADIIYQFMLLLLLTKKKIIIVGWSLGGQIGYSLMKKYTIYIHGVVVWGAPPVPDNDLMIGFNNFPEAAMMGYEGPFTREQAEIFNRAAGLPNERIYVNDCMICDGRSRSYMIAASTTGGSVDARTLMAETKIPIIIITGGKDQGVRREYIEKEVKYSSLVYMQHIPDGNHALHHYYPQVINDAINNLVKLI